MNTVTGELWSALVGCWELFRLAPIRCADGPVPSLRLSTLFFTPCCDNYKKGCLLCHLLNVKVVFFLTNRVDPDRAAPVGAIRSGVTLFTSLFKLVNIMRQQTASAEGNI